MSNYFGFSISDSMFGEDLVLTRTTITAGEAAVLVDAWKKEGNLVPCINPSHQATIAAAKERFGISVEIPQVAPRAEVEAGDKILVMQVKGLPRLDASRHEYTESEIASATFGFAVYTAYPVSSVWETWYSGCSYGQGCQENMDNLGINVCSERGKNLLRKKYGAEAVKRFVR